MSDNSERVKKWRKRFKRKMILAMGDSCQCCGYNKCDEALEFHHIDPLQKDFSLSQIRASPKKLSLIIEELKKCVLVCCLCHREIHANLRQVPEDFQSLDESIMISEFQLRRNFKKQSSVIKSVPMDRRKIFLSNPELIDLLKTHYNGNKSALARSLNVSEAAIRKRLASSR